MEVKFCPLIKGDCLQGTCEFWTIKQERYYETWKTMLGTSGCWNYRDYGACGLKNRGKSSV